MLIRFPSALTSFADLQCVRTGTIVSVRIASPLSDLRSWCRAQPWIDGVYAAEIAIDCVAIAQSLSP